MVLLVSIQAGAVETYRARSTVVGCVDPLSALALDGSVPRHPHGAAWRRAVRRNGRCYTVRPAERWEWIAGAEPHLLLLRREKPRPGAPPLYFSFGLMQPEAERDHLQREPRVLRYLAAHHVGPAVHRRHVPHDPTSAPRRPHIEVQTLPMVAAPAAPAQPSAAPRPVPPLQTRGAASVASTGVAPMAVSPEPPVAPAAPGPAVMQSERIGRVIGMVLLFAVLAGFTGLAAFVFWRVRRLARANADAMIAMNAIPATVPTAAGSRPTQDRRAPDSAVATEAQAVPQDPGDTSEGPAARTPFKGAAPVIGRPATASGAMTDYKNRCVSMLRLAGWEVRTRFPGGTREPDLIAQRGTRLLALQCHLSADPVDVEAVEDACLARERQRSDLAAIVSGSHFTEAAQQLADRTGVVLLHDHELASFGA